MIAQVCVGNRAPSVRTPVLSITVSKERRGTETDVKGQAWRRRWGDAGELRGLRGAKRHPLPLSSNLSNCISNAAEAILQTMHIGPFYRGLFEVRM